MSRQGATVSAIRRALDSPELRPEYEEWWRLVGLAAARHGQGDARGHEAAASESVTAAYHLVARLRAKGVVGPHLDDVQVAKVITDLGMDEFVNPTVKSQYRPIGFGVRLPAGRTPGKRTPEREAVLVRLRANRLMDDAELAAIARELDPSWPRDPTDDDPENLRKRLARLRRDAGL